MMSGFRADFCCIRMFELRPLAPPALTQKRRAERRHGETSRKKYKNQPLWFPQNAETSCASDGRQSGLDGGVKEEEDLSWIQSGNTRRERAGLSPRLSAPHAARTWQWGQPSSSIIPSVARAATPAIHHRYQQLFICFFISLFLPQTARRAHTRPSSRSVSGWIGNSIHLRSLSLLRAALIIFSYHLKLIFSSAAFMAAWLKGLSLSAAAQLCFPHRKKSLFPLIKEP